MLAVLDTVAMLLKRKVGIPGNTLRVGLEGTQKIANLLPHFPVL